MFVDYLYYQKKSLKTPEDKNYYLLSIVYYQW